jgi:hypothetical protein
VIFNFLQWRELQELGDIDAPNFGDVGFAVASVLLLAC